MLCPKCKAVFEERFCPQCGLDRQIFAEVAVIKGEIESLRQLVLSSAQTIPETGIAAGLADAKESVTAESGKTPPPLPRHLIKAEPKKSAPGGSAAELAVGQKWLLGIG